MNAKATAQEWIDKGRAYLRYLFIIKSNFGELLDAQTKQINDNVDYYDLRLVIID